MTRRRRVRSRDNQSPDTPDCQEAVSSSASLHHREESGAGILRNLGATYNSVTGTESCGNHGLSPFIALACLPSGRHRSMSTSFFRCGGPIPACMLWPATRMDRGVSQVVAVNANRTPSRIEDLTLRAAGTHHERWRQPASRCFYRFAAGLAAAVSRRVQSRARFLRRGRRMVQRMEDIAATVANGAERLELLSRGPRDHGFRARGRRSG
jgi:hypothetical protein